MENYHVKSIGDDPHYFGSISADSEKEAAEIFGRNLWNFYAYSKEYEKLSNFSNVQVEVTDENNVMTLFTVKNGIIIKAFKD